LRSNQSCTTMVGGVKGGRHCRLSDGVEEEEENFSGGKEMGLYATYLDNL
jgi:hypothetical protein